MATKLLFQTGDKVAFQDPASGGLTSGGIVIEAVAVGDTGPVLVRQEVGYGTHRTISVPQAWDITVVEGAGARAQRAKLIEAREVTRGQVAVLQQKLMDCYLDDHPEMARIGKALGVLARRLAKQDAQIAALGYPTPLAYAPKGTVADLTDVPLCKNGCGERAELYDGTAGGFWCGFCAPVLSRRGA